MILIGRNASEGSLVYHAVMKQWGERMFGGGVEEWEEGMKENMKKERCA